MTDNELTLEERANNCALDFASRDEQFKTFTEFIISKRQFCNKEQFDVEFDEEYPGYGYYGKANKLTVAAQMLGDNIRVGIDASKYFNKVQDSNIIALFPMSRREFARFMKIVEQAYDKKSTFYKQLMDDDYEFPYGTHHYNYY